MGAELSSAQTGAVRVWHARTVDVWHNRGPDPHAAAWLTPAERVRYTRYRRDVDREMFLLGRMMARALVGRELGCPPTDWPWRDGQRGRPEIDTGEAPAPCSFNLAHSGGLVVCALARVGQVGIDVEDRDRRPVDPPVVRRFCSPAEVADIEQAGVTGWHDRFLQYWTLKEAYLKACGLGIAVPLSEISFTVGAAGTPPRLLHAPGDTPAAWHFRLETIVPHHYLAVGVSSDVPRTFSVEPFPVELISA